MAQPFDRKASLPAMGALDSAAGQFWVGNPWEIVANAKNLSAYERNRTFLNLGDGQFADISYLTGTDSDGDGRSCIAADLNNDGMLDLVVRQAGGGPLLMFKNRFPGQHYLRVSLRGRRSNGQGIGAKLVAEAGGRRMVREMYPANTYAAQHPCELYFGLGSDRRVDRLTIRWPSGLTQELSDVSADQHLLIQEGDSAPRLVAAGLSR